MSRLHTITATRRVTTFARTSLAIAVLATTATTTAHATTPDAAVAALNAQRTANGIPGGVTTNAAWSASCAAHNGYLRANGMLVHEQRPGAPGASADGAWAGVNSVLASTPSGSYPWSRNPWENAPFHLAQVLQPGLRSVGYDDDGRYACMTTWPGTDDAGLDGVFTYPGPGRTDVPPSQSARELPSTPQQSVGIAATATTGPNLLVFARGLGGSAIRVTAASLTPDVPVRWVDATTPVVGTLIPSGAILVPVTPLRPDTDYTASVTLAGAARTTTHTWSFKTGAPSASLADSSAKIGAAFRPLGRCRVQVTGVANGSPVVVSVQLVRRGARPQTQRVRTTPSGTFSTTVRSRQRGMANVCATIGRLKVCKRLRL